jgi:hypothetical protein
VRANACEKRDFVVQDFYSPDRVQRLSNANGGEKRAIAGAFGEWRAGEKNFI